MNLKRLRTLGATLLALLAVGLMPLPAHAVIVTEKVVITCGPHCVSQGRSYLEAMIAWSDLLMYLQDAYSPRGQWQEFQDNALMIVATFSLDARCSAAVAAQAGTTTASSTLQQQKTAAENAYTAMKNGMSSAQLSDFIAKLPTSAGTTTNGASFPAGTKIITIIWPADGSQSSFTFTVGGSGYGIGQHVGWKAKPPGEANMCQQ